jgi:mRNA-degrading endonuclease RelE of RelBE toxin-antitoxin system
MEFTFKFSKGFQKSMKKLKKKDKVLFLKIKKKLFDIIKNPDHYKPLRNVFAGYRRIKLGSFVLVFTIKGKIVSIISLDHHDKAY